MNDPDNTQLYRANESDNSNELKQHYAACRIQRTWRNYQTLKIVRKHYEYYRALMRREKEERSVWREAGNRLGRNSGRNVVGERSIEKSTKESMEKRRSGREPERRIAYDKYGREGASWSGESE